MSSTNTIYNTTLRLNNVPNDDTLTRFLAIDMSDLNPVAPKKIQTRDMVTLSGANQTLNTTDNVSFVSVTSPQDFAQFNGTMTFVTNNITIAQATIKTTTNTATTIYTLNTVTNKSYTIFVEAVLVDGSPSVAGDAGFVMTRRVTNTSNVLDIGAVETFMTRQGNSSTSNIQFVASGATLNIQVIGITGNNNYWTVFIRIIKSP